jgi:hypothetical protein
MAAGMDEQSDKDIASKKQRDQMLKLVAKGFYNELINYGVGQPEVIRVASHLLDNLLAKGKRPDKDVGYYNGIFTLASVKDEWAERKQLAVQHVTLRPLQKQVVKQGRRLAQRPGRARKLCTSVSRKQKQATRVFYFTNARILQHRLQQRSGGNYRRREY